MRPHYCLTDNRPEQYPQLIVCLCSTGRDHTEEEFDSPAYIPEDDDPPPAAAPLAEAA